jgi:hypothetical protein
MLIFAAILAGITALLVFVTLVVLAISIQVTDRHQGLRDSSYSRIDALARRVLGVYVDRPIARARNDRNADNYDHAGR